MEQTSENVLRVTRRAADRLREATDLLGGAQKQQASSKLDSLGREADRISKEENAQADRVRKLAAQGEAMSAKANAGTMPSPAEMAAAEKERGGLADDRQQMSNDLEKLQKGLRDTARELAPTQPGAASNLRDALSGLDQNDLTNLVQRTADWLRRGVNPNSNGTETEIATGLKKLDDQVRQAQQAAGSGQNGRPGQAPGTQEAELGHVDRLRSSIESLSPGRGAGDRPGQQPGQPGQNGRQGQNGQQGQQGGQRGQGQRGQGQGQQQGQGGQQGQGNRAGQNGRQGGPGQRSGQQDGAIAYGELRGGGGSTAANLNVDTGGQKYDSSRRPDAPQTGSNPADRQRAVDQGMGELSQLRQLAKGDAVTQKEIDDLSREMQNLDPARFPGNPAMVEELHTKVLNDVDKLELQLRHSDDSQPGQVRTATPQNVPPGYQDAVAEYYRRLGKGQ